MKVVMVRLRTKYAPIPRSAFANRPQQVQSFVPDVPIETNMGPRQAVKQRRIALTRKLRRPS